MNAYLGEIASVVCAVIWSLAVVCFIRAGEHISPLALNLFKTTIAIPLFALIMVATGIDFFPDLGAWQYGMLAVSGVLGIAVGDTLQFACYMRVGAGWSAVVSAMHPPIMIGVTALAFGVSLTVSVAIGAALIVVAILLSQDQSTPVDRRRTLAIGLAIGALSQLVMAIGIAIMKYPVAGRPPSFDVAPLLLVTFWRLAMGTVALAVWMGITSPGEIRAAFRWNPTWRWMVAGSLLGGFVAMTIWIYGLREITGSITRAVILNQSTAIFMPLFGLWLLKERIGARKVVSIATAFTGAVIVAAGK